MTDSIPLCKHFGECGGCLNQDVAYTQQIELKRNVVEEMFCDFWNAQVPITPSPVLWHYRNKVDPSFALKWYEEAPPADFVRETVLGFKCKGKWFKPLDMMECRIAPPGLEALLEGTREWHTTHGLCACEPRRSRGYLRNLLVRDGKRTGERMVVLITMPGIFEHAASFVEMARNCFNASSIYHGEFDGKADVATANKLTLLYGKDAIHETLHVSASQATTNDLPDQSDLLDICSITFRISPLSFFQTNPLAAERLYGHIRAWVMQCRPDVLFDLYGGSGGIALSCADHVKEIISVENVSAASEDGRHNCHENNISNVLFITDSVRNYLRAKLDGGGFPGNSAVVVDPPRSGMHPKAIRRLIELAPKNLLYVSCNPKRLREELPEFLPAYHLVSLKAVDMFPHTPHLEVIAALEKF